MSDDRALLDAWHSGDEQSGQRLFARHFDSVCRFFAMKVGSGIDDLVQRTFLACIERRDSWPEGAEFRPYLFGIARNILRRRLREKEYAGRRFDMLESSVAGSGRTPSSIIHEKREVQVLIRALQRLPVDLQIAVELRFWEDMTVPQIAGVLEIPEGTTKTRLRRARQLLEEEVEKAAGDAELARSTVADLESWAQLLKKRLATE